MSIEIPGTATAGYYAMQSTSKSATLTQDQLQLVEETLSNYDPNQLTQSDASDIVAAFSDAGITAGRELAETMASFGFDASTVGEMAGVGQTQGDRPPPPPSGGNVLTLNISDDMLQQLNQLLTDYYDTDLTDAEKTSTLDAIKDIFQQTMPEGGLVDIRA